MHRPMGRADGFGHLCEPGAWHQVFNCVAAERNMKRSFLDYYKLILDKVAFDKDLLRKEYSKAMTRLPERDKRHLDEWVRSKGFF